MMNQSKNKLIDFTQTSQNAMHHNMHWLDIRECNSEDDLPSQYANICKKHHLNNKWILMINPKVDCLQQLSAEIGIKTRNILQVHTQSTKTAQKNIESALAKGHCSAVILCDPCLKKEDICQLEQSAQQGKTTCIVLSKQRVNHKQNLH